MRPPTYFRLCTEARDRYLAERDNLARVLRAVLDKHHRSNDPSQKVSDAVREAREALAALSHASSPPTAASPPTIRGSGN